MAVLARFYVAEITRYANGMKRPGYADPAPIGKVTLRPVTRGEANAIWASATPSGEMTMTINGSAMSWFEERLGSEISIRLEDAPPQE